MSSNTLIGGDTVVTVPEGTVAALTGLDVTVSGFGSAKLSFDTAGDLLADFPITGGYAGAYDVILHQGSGLSLLDSHGSITVSDFRVDTQTDVVYGDVSLKTGSTTVSESNVDLFNIGSGLSLTFTNDAIGAVNKALGSSLTTAVPVGTAAPNPVANPLPTSFEEWRLVRDLFHDYGFRGPTQPIVSGQTDVTLTSAGTLASLGVHVATLGSATLNTSGPNPVAEFPITGGTEQSSGDVILHEGSGLALTGAGHTVDLQNFLVDTIHGAVDAHVTIDGKFAGDLAVFNVGAGGTLTLTSAAAGALDSTFGTSALSASTVVGTASPHPFALTPTEAAVFSRLNRFACHSQRRRRSPTAPAAAPEAHHARREGFRHVRSDDPTAHV